MSDARSADDQVECRGCGLFSLRSECQNGTCRRCGCKVQPARLAPRYHEVVRHEDGTQFVPTDSGYIQVDP